MDSGNDILLVLLRSGVKRKIIEELAKGGKTPSDLAILLGTKLPNITLALKDLLGHFLVYQTNPDERKGKIYALTEQGLNSLSKLQDRGILEGVKRFINTEAKISTYEDWKRYTYEGHVLNASSSRFKCSFNRPVQRWDIIAARFSSELGTYVTIGMIVNVIEVKPYIQPNISERRIPSHAYLADTVILDTLLDGRIISQAPLIPLGNTVDTASPTEVERVLGIEEVLTLEKSVTFGTMLGRPHFDIRFPFSSIGNMLISGIFGSGKTQLAKDIMKDTVENGSMVIYFSNRSEQFNHSVDAIKVSVAEILEKQQIDIKGTIRKLILDWDFVELWLNITIPWQYKNMWTSFYDFETRSVADDREIFEESDSTDETDSIHEPSLLKMPSDEYQKYLQAQNERQISHHEDQKLSHSDIEELTDIEFLLNEGGLIMIDSINVTQAFGNIFYLWLMEKIQSYALQHRNKKIVIVVDPADFLLMEKHENQKRFNRFKNLLNGYDIESMLTILISNMPQTLRHNIDTFLFSTVVLGRLHPSEDLDKLFKDYLLPRSGLTISEISSKFARSEFMVLNHYLRFPVLFSRPEERKALDLWEDEKTLEIELESFAKDHRLDVNRDVPIHGNTTTHHIDFAIKKGERVYLIEIKKFKGTLSQSMQAKQWIFPAVDIKRTQNEKIIFVYYGYGLEPTASKILEHYYDLVMPFHEFKEFIIKPQTILSCYKVGFDCDYVIEGDTEEEITKNAVQHIWKQHGVKPEEISSEMKEKITENITSGK